MNPRSLKTAASAFLVSAIMAFGLAPVAHAESVMKECGDNWKTAKANNTTNGQTWQEFLKACRAQKSASAAPAAAAAPAPAPAVAPAPAPMAPAPAAAPKPAPMKTAARPTGAGEFSTEAEARARCGDSVVWVNTKSHVYHLPGTRSYGTTKQGAYMCQADADASGDRASRSKIGNKAKEPQ